MFTNSIDSIMKTFVKAQTKLTKYEAKQLANMTKAQEQLNYAVGEAGRANNIRQKLEALLG